MNTDRDKHIREILILTNDYDKTGLYIFYSYAELIEIHGQLKQKKQKMEKQEKMKIEKAKIIKEIMKTSDEYSEMGQYLFHCDEAQLIKLLNKLRLKNMKHKAN